MTVTRFFYRWHRCRIYFRAGQEPGGWIGWALAWPDRTTGYYQTPAEAREAARRLVDASLAERRGEDPGPGA